MFCATDTFQLVAAGRGLRSVRNKTSAQGYQKKKHLDPSSETKNIQLILFGFRGNETRIGEDLLEVTRLVNSSKSGKTLRKPPTLSTVSSRWNIAHYPTKRDANLLNKSKKNAIYWKKTCQSHKKRCDKCLKRTTWHFSAKYVNVLMINQLVNTLKHQIFAGEACWERDTVCQRTSPPLVDGGMCGAQLPTGVKGHTQLLALCVCLSLSCHWDRRGRHLLCSESPSTRLEREKQSQKKKWAGNSGEEGRTSELLWAQRREKI